MTSTGRRTHLATTAGLALVGAALVAAAATGCAPAVAPEPTASLSAAPAATPTPTQVAIPSSTPTVDPSVLFTISVTLTSPGKNGAVADLVQTVYAPVPLASVTASDLAAIKTQCAGLIVTSANPTYLKTKVTSTLEKGSSPWPGDDAVGVLEGGGNGSAWSGSYIPFETACEGPIIEIPGEADGITLIPSVKSASEPTGWTVGQYGFGYFYDVDAISDITKSERYKFSKCTLQLGPLAAANPISAKWPSQVKPQPSGLAGCGVGQR